MAIKFNRSQTFATNGTVTAAGLHNLIDGTDIYQALITDQTNLTSVGSADELLIADADLTANDAPRAVTVNELFEDALTISTYTNANINNISYGTSTGTRIVSTNASITTGTIPNLTSSTASITIGTIPTLTAGTTTSTAANITNGTIQTLTSSTATITGGISSTSGTIPTLVATTLITTGTGTAATPAIVPTGDTNTGIFFPAADTIAATTQGTERLRIDSSGRVGIGVAPSNYKLEIDGTGANGGFVAGGSLNGGQSGGDYDSIGYNFRPTNSSDVYNYNLNDTSSRIEFYNGGFLFKTASSGIAGNAITYAERLRIASAGQIGIGGANYGTSGQVLTSNGAAAAPSWQAAGKILQVVSATTSSVVTCGTTIPWDDTIPQITEGNEVLNLTITPLSATSALYIKFDASGSASGAVNNAATIAFFKDSVANAIYATQVHFWNAIGYGNKFNASYKENSSSTTSRTYRVRVGADSPTIYINGNGSGARRYGGVSTAILEIWEVEV